MMDVLHYIHRIIILIQARAGSTRLPAKVLKKIMGREVLLHMYERVAKTNYAEKFVIITSSKNENDQIVDLCGKTDIACYRGSEGDLLDRHYQAAVEFRADAVVKIPSDCPLIDPAIIDRVLKYYLDNNEKYDYVSNLHPATYPDGNDVEIMSFKALETAWKEAKKDYERQHTTPFIWENPDRFRIGNVLWETSLDYSTTHRWTLDYEEDFEFIKTVFESLYHKQPDFGIQDILDLLEENPHISKINSRYVGKYWYENHLNELNHIEEYKQKVAKIGTKQETKNSKQI